MSTTIKSYLNYVCLKNVHSERDGLAINASLKNSLSQLTKWESPNINRWYSRWYEEKL